ncbi:class I SAM-dependent methyltransferase [Sporolactobacillus sp. KGMB 08714]|uniref:class I SAM-dependent methyltransferase n=1 Tax=Sporolactobacillus sp. KGMB 08714 TaxID=3064704 RepID=UPI002FBE3B98
MNEHTLQEDWINAVTTAVSLIEQAGVPYTLEGIGALVVQGVMARPREKSETRLSVQWDAMTEIQRLFHSYGAGAVEERGRETSFLFKIDCFSFRIVCRHGEVIRTDPERLRIFFSGFALFVKSVDSFLYVLKKDDPVYLEIKKYLHRLQESAAGQNGRAWNDEAYKAWVERFGPPEQAAEKIRRDPEGRLAQLAAYIGDPRGKKIINLLGSHGGKALALEILGASVTVADISEENAAYARQTAAALHVDLNYIVSDVLNLPDKIQKPENDLVLMELGVLHYFVDLEPLASLIYRLLKPGGKLVLQEFHPVSMKLVTTRGKKQVVFGNYFDKKPRERAVAFSKHLASAEELQNKVYLREWTLGEIVTAFAQAGLRVERLDEAPNMKISDIGIPKIFTLVCSK